MNNYLNLNQNAWDNIQLLANCEKGDNISCKGEKIYIKKQVENQTNQDKEIAASLLNKSINNICSSIKAIKQNDEKTNSNLSSITKTVEKALKNYQLLGFDQIVPLNLQEVQLPSLNEPLHEDIKFFDPMESSIIKELQQVRQALAKANNSSLDVVTRATYMPQMTGAMTANGTYFICADSLLNQLSDEPVVERMFVAKPALQEAGSPKNPQGNDQTRDGIKGGEGVIRERMVYAGQKLLNVDFGIPPTVVIQEQNNFLSSEVDFAKIMNSLESIKKINPDMTLPKFIELMKKGNALEEISGLIESQATASITPFEMAMREAILKLKNEGVKIAYPALVKELRNKFPMPEIQQQASTLKQAVEKELSLGGLRQSVETLWNQLLISTEKKAMMSMQQFASDCCSLGGLSLEDQNKLPVEEIHKLVLDFVFFNTDRHLHNILVDMKTSTPSLVLIDHGSCLPRPLGKEEGKGLKQARYEFLELSQCKVPLHPKFANPIKELNIEQFITSLKKDQCHHKEFFGELCDIPEECYDLIRLNLHILQTGIEMEATFKEIGNIHQISQSLGIFSGGEIVDIYLKHIESNDKVNWIEVKNEIKSILIKNKKDICK